jgi:hypothetical protein
LSPFDDENNGVWTPSIWKSLLGERVIRQKSCVSYTNWLLPPSLSLL